MSSPKLPAYRYRITVVRVIDGDTLECDVDLGFYATISTKLRLFGIDCPEIGTTQGKFAREYVFGCIAGNLKGIVADVIKADKYGNRWDAVVYLPDGSSLNDRLVEAGHAIRKTYKNQGEGDV